MDRSDRSLVEDDGGSGGSRVVADPERIRVLYVGEKRASADAPAEIETRHDHLEVTVERAPETAFDTLEDGGYDCLIYAPERAENDVRAVLEAVREIDSQLPTIVYGEPAVFDDAHAIDGVDLVRRGGEGEYAVLTSRVRNATARYRASERVGELESDLRRFHNAVDHAGHVVLITDADGVIEYVNPAFEEETGYDCGEAIGRTPAMLKSGEHDERFYRDLWETILEGKAWRGEIVNCRPDGERYVIDQTIAPIDGDDGEPVGFVAINKDITELKEYERELEAQNDRLEQYGRMVAHDLRNPLTLLSAEVENARTVLDGDAGATREELEGELRRGLLEIEEITEYMRRLIEDLLQLAEHGQLVLDAEEVDLEAVAHKAWREVDSPAAKLVVENGHLEANPARLRELFSNLFRNAVEHGGEDATVRVGPLEVVEGFYVEDDGSGIPEDERDRVLDRGYTTAEDGTGFGLAVAARIADAHEWAVRVTESAEGGARFEFRPDAYS